MVTPSAARRMSISRASAADFATCAVEIISNALPIGGIGPLPGFFAAAQRATNSLHPPQAGSTPTPTSTRPV
ncbi:hypothetical protein D3C83_149920 [compost metagenome]